MRAGLAAVVTGILALAGCGPRQSSDVPKQAAVTTPSPEEQRNAAFWKEAAGVHFEEDRSHRGEALPAATLFDASGRITTLAAHRGKPLLVNFWAHWCVPCRAEMPTIDAMAEKRGASLQVIAVNADRVRASAKSLGPLPMSPLIVQLYDRDLTLAKPIADQGLPTTVLYGSDGRERWRLTGVLDWTKPQAQRLLTEGT